MRKSQKAKLPKPDEIHQLGPLAIARFGNTIVVKNTMSNDEFNEFLKKAAAEYPKIYKEIDNLVLEIRESVSIFEPLSLLKYGYLHFASSVIGKKSEAQFGPNDIIDLRMLDYLQSVIVSTPLKNKKSSQFDENQWLQLKEKVTELYRSLTLSFHIAATAQQKINDPSYPSELDDFKVQAQMLWISVRGKRYPIHDITYLRTVLAPHDFVLQNLFGVSTDTLLRGLEALYESLTKGLPQAMKEFREFKEKSLALLDTRLTKSTTKEQLPELMKEVIKEKGWEDWQASIFDRCFGFDLFNVEKLTGWPKRFLDELAFEPGEDNDFFAEGQFAGWPLRLLPIQKKPFLKIKERYYCFDLMALMDNFYRALQRPIFRLKPEYKQSWNEYQKQISEKLPFDLLNKILPKAVIHRNVFHEWKTGQSGKHWCETDGLIIYDDHLIIIEVKAGAFTYTSPATDFDAYVESIRELVLKPVEQAKRFANYLKSKDEVTIFNAAHQEIARLRHKDFRHITACCVTLDSFTTMATQAQALKTFANHHQDFPVWSVSIDDLFVYADIFNAPIHFIHFLEERQRAFQVRALDQTDEIGHLALYFRYSRYADIVNSESNLINWRSYHQDIDAYFYDLMVDPSKANRPGQKLPKTFNRITELLAEQSKPGCCRVGCYLLSFAGDTRNALSTHIDEAFKLQMQLGHILPFSLFGKAKLTVFCLQIDIITPSKAWMHDYVLATLFRAQEDQRLMLIIRYDSNCQMVDIDYTFLLREDIPKNRFPEIQRLSEEYARSRVASYLRQAQENKIGRNEICPCGSGKKYKRCCGMKS